MIREQLSNFYSYNFFYDQILDNLVSPVSWFAPRFVSAPPAPISLFIGHTHQVQSMGLEVCNKWILALTLAGKDTNSILPDAKNSKQ